MSFAAKNLIKIHQHKSQNQNENDTKMKNTTEGKGDRTRNWLINDVSQTYIFPEEENLWWLMRVYFSFIEGKMHVYIVVKKKYVEIRRIRTESALELLKVCTQCSFELL